jgi:hypothetical protein
MDQPSTWRSAALVVSFMLCILSWELTAAMFVGHWLFGAGWFGPDREWAAFGVSAALSVYYGFWGRNLIREHHRKVGQEHMTGGQAIAVIVLAVAAGAFGTWLFCG